MFVCLTRCEKKLKIPEVTGDFKAGTEGFCGGKESPNISSTVWEGKVGSAKLVFVGERGAAIRGGPQVRVSGRTSI